LGRPANPVAMSAGQIGIPPRSHEAIERRVQGKNGARDVGRDDDARRLETVGRLTAGVAHDFNNMLSVILASASELEEGLRSAEDRERASEIRAAAERGARLTRQLLTYSRPERAEPQPVDLNLATLDAIRLLDRTIGAEVELRSDPAAGLPMVLLVPGQAEQIIVNLATNARDAMPDGGRITIRTRLSSITPNDPGLGAGWHVRLTVCDNGTGMPEEVVERALEPFFTTKDRSRGTGLGLATVSEIARAAGGDVRISSRPGEGTDVSVYLPALRAIGSLPELGSQGN
jgi:signal transduction histidine kinase